jgi:hypothetical protein
MKTLNHSRAEYKHLNEVVPFLPNFNGAYAYSGALAVTRFINNAPSGISLTAGDPTLAFTEDDQYYFFQDDFKIRPNFTLLILACVTSTPGSPSISCTMTVARETGPTRFTIRLAVERGPCRRFPLIRTTLRRGLALPGRRILKGLSAFAPGNRRDRFRGGYSIAYDASFYNILLKCRMVRRFPRRLPCPTLMRSRQLPPRRCRCRVLHLATSFEAMRPGECCRWAN